MFEIEWIPNKPVYRNLILIKGISSTLAYRICALLGISPNTDYSSLLPHKVDQLNHLLSIFRKKVTPFYIPFFINKKKSRFNPILANLDEFRKDNVKMQISLNSWRGKRIKQGYPVHGQRTRSNARTAHRLNRSAFF